MKVRNIDHRPREIPSLGVVVDPDAAVTVPAEWGPEFLAQPWAWEAADDEADAAAAAHPDWWDHPHVAVVEAAGGRIADRPMGGEL